MYLKRLELCGFKSFADKTRMDFEPGISAVIGPNGCGKSNISDAIRWCLGEQSVKSMRSKQMLDVIFGGSQSRPTTGMAEVTLTFDNTNNVLPLDYSEVSITRRLFRSSEAEYFINRIQCRLKDIRDLFLDTGIGSEGYSIIEQGKVEFLLLASAEERRELFEEAAGVSKYKVRREETLRKLDKVEIDMNRVNDMLALLKDQISALDLAAKKARQYQKHKTDLKRLEITSLVHAIAHDQQEVDRIKTDIDPLILNYESNNTVLNQTEADLSELRVMQVQKDDEFLKIQNDFAQIKSDINLADERILQAQQREQELVERRLALTAETQADEQRIAQYEQELTHVREMAASLADEVSRLEQQYHSREEDIARIRASIAETDSRQAAAKEHLFTCATDRTSLNNEQNRLTSLQLHAQAQIASLQKDLERHSENEGPVNADIAARQAAIAEAAAAHRNGEEMLARAREEIVAIETQVRRALDDRRALQEKIIALESRANMIREWEQKDPLRTIMRAVQSAGIPGIRGPVSGLIEIDPGMEEVVSAALGETLHYMVADTAESARAAIKLLKETGGGRLTFLILEHLPESLHGQPIALTHTSRALVSLVRSAPHFQRMVKYLCQDIVVDGTDIYGKVILQGGSTISFDQPVMIEGQLQRITEEADAIRRDIEQAGTVITEQEAALGSRREQYRAAEMEFHRTEIQNDWLQKQLAARLEEQDLIRTGLTLTKNDIATREAELQQVAVQMATVGEQLAGLAGREQGSTEELSRLDAELQTWRAQEEQAAALLTEAKVTWATQANELAGRQREEQKLATMTEETRARVEQGRLELDGIESRIVEMTNVRASESERLNTLRGTLEGRERDVQDRLNERQSLLSTLEQKNAVIVEMRRQVEMLQQDIHTRQMDLRSFELKLQSSQQRLMEEYAGTFEELKAEYLPLPVDEEEVARLKRKIDAMGAVNLAAPEEYTTLEERYNFLLTQQQDLIKAKEDMLEVIAKINHTTRDHFKLTFGQVRENFRTLYHQLFEGGEADLILTDESNLLETGVEILAQPPGKKLQNITLLSGGEKALTAIALLFAFFMVRPSPFCILDEVDAPLDDANIGRYINMIKAFAERTQFLVVTHNKRTMEMANVLYGVTMEELGVSKIISVKLNKVNELAAV